jgi:hypothetical protein
MLSSNMLLLNLILLIDVTFSTPQPFTKEGEMPTLLMAMSARGERINYLSLALQARSAIKRLRQLAPGSVLSPELRSALKAALNSLTEPTPQKGELYSKLYDEDGFNRFEEVQTVEEVLRVLGDSKLKEEIGNVMAGDRYTEEDVRATIRFFSALENRALYHYDDPSLAENLH